MTAWHCDNCGHDANDASDPRCHACGEYRMPRRVVLAGEASGDELAMHITTKVGQRLLATVDAADSQFASSDQFEIVKTESGWQVRHEASATNPTFYNGSPLSAEPQSLEPDTIISIGPDRLKLRVRLEY